MTLSQEQTFDFSLLIPTNSGSALRQLIETFETRSLANINRLLNSEYQKYSPWMSMEGLEQKLQSLFKVPTPPAVLLVDSQYLQALASVVEYDEANALAFFGTEAGGMKIAQQVGSENARLFDQAKSLLFDVLPDFRTTFNLITRFIVPVTIPDREISTMAGFSSLLCPGVIFLSLPVVGRRYWRVELAIELAHELAHNVIGLYQRADRLIADDVEQAVYSGILDRDRPGIMALHGAAALAYISIVAASFSHHPIVSQEERDYAFRELTIAAPKLDATTRALVRTCNFTPFGKRLIENLCDAAKYAMFVASEQ